MALRKRTSVPYNVLRSFQHCKLYEIYDILYLFDQALLKILQPQNRSQRRKAEESKELGSKVAESGVPAISMSFG